jgi:(1->4)-alpha-D-glucan 1-alpha-D-glucosylmutase
VKASLQNSVNIVNNQRTTPKGIQFIGELLERQWYRLAFWRSGLGEVNYRRFFDISDLVCLHIEKDEVLEATHTLVFNLVREGKVTGLRIDHIDGLYDPFEYLGRLQRWSIEKEEAANTQRGFYVVVEKILTGEEALPEE